MGSVCDYMRMSLKRTPKSSIQIKGKTKVFGIKYDHNGREWGFSETVRGKLNGWGIETRERNATNQRREVSTGEKWTVHETEIQRRNEDNPRGGSWCQSTGFFPELKPDFNRKVNRCIVGGGTFGVHPPLFERGWGTPPTPQMKYFGVM